MSLFSRFTIYLSERFSFNAVIGSLLFSTSVYLACLGINHQEHNIQTALGISAVVVGMFFILRVCDEYKDFHEDTQYRPSRPVPRGLITLRELTIAAISVMVFQLLIVVVLFPGALIPLIVTWSYIALMLYEFGIGSWLRKHIIAYLISHMIVMGIMAYLIVGMAAAHVDNLNQMLLSLYAIGLGSMAEISRKFRHPDKEIPGVESYSNVLGSNGGLLWWILSAATMASVSSLAYLNGLNLNLVNLYYFASILTLSISCVFMMFNARNIAKLSYFIKGMTVLITIMVVLGITLVGRF